jgi:hypothetical protein
MTMSPRARPSNSYSNELAGPSTARSFSFAPCLKPDMEHGKHRLHRELSKTPTYGSPSITTHCVVGAPLPRLTCPNSLPPRDLLMLSPHPPTLGA